MRNASTLKGAIQTSVLMALCCHVRLPGFGDSLICSMLVRKIGMKRVYQRCIPTCSAASQTAMICSCGTTSHAFNSKLVLRGKTSVRRSKAKCVPITNGPSSATVLARSNDQCIVTTSKTSKLIDKAIYKLGTSLTISIRKCTCQIMGVNDLC